MVRSYGLHVFRTDTTQVVSLANIIIALTFPVSLSTFLDLAASECSNSPGMWSHRLNLFWSSHCKSPLEHITHTSFMDLQVVPCDPCRPCMPCCPPHPRMRAFHVRWPSRSQKPFLSKPLPAGPYITWLDRIIQLMRCQSFADWDAIFCWYVYRTIVPSFLIPGCIMALVPPALSSPLLIFFLVVACLLNSPATIVGWHLESEYVNVVRARAPRSW